ncbi:MAG: exodeoxyribonuclease V subunit alpha [SAR324 cluster bacterium]|nr:exodeoxyribonuclease V subunit alpha [SAR324 cluster bacterium]
MITAKRLYELGYLDSMDYCFGSYLTQISGKADEFVELAVALTHRATMKGHVCLSLNNLTTIEIEEGSQSLQIEFPKLEQLLDHLIKSSLIGKGLSLASNGLDQNLASPTKPSTPLVLDEKNRLYLARYYDYQQRLVAEIKKRENFEVIDPAWVKVQVGLYFDKKGDVKGIKVEEVDEQRLAAINGLFHRVSLIAGGPGTGKTTTVAKVLTLAYSWYLSCGNITPRFLLLAPTGKAASRLMDALQEKLEELHLPPQLKGLLELETSTIHRALKFNPKEPTEFHHSKFNPLSTDLVLVDEASMIDLPLLTKLFEAVPESAKILLLGDPNQLASVEAGAVFGDLVNQDHRPSMSNKQREMYQNFMEPIANLPSSSSSTQTGFNDQITTLSKSYRFAQGQDIALLAKAIKQKNSREAFNILASSEDIQLVTPKKEYNLELMEHCLKGYQPFLKAKTQQEALTALGNFTLLTAHRQGFYGANWANEALTQYFNLKNKIDSHKNWYHLRPIMVTANNHEQELYNGDTGVIFRNSNLEHLPLEANFTGKSLSIKALNPALLPAHESTWAMTIHKSQGSEFNEVAILLPQKQSQALSVELIYTALTRAKKKVVIFSSKEVLTAAIEKSIVRDSGISDALWGESLN